jgi:hypothetical protein
MAEGSLLTPVARSLLSNENWLQIGQIDVSRWRLNFPSRVILTEGELP